MALENQVTFAEVGNPKRVTQLTENTDAAGAYFLTEKVGETAAKKTSYATVESAVKSKVQSEYLQTLSATPASDKTMSEKLVVGELNKRDQKIAQLDARTTACDASSEGLVISNDDLFTQGSFTDNIPNRISDRNYHAVVENQEMKTTINDNTKFYSFEYYDESKQLLTDFKFTLRSGAQSTIIPKGVHYVRFVIRNGSDGVNSITPGDYGFKAVITTTIGVINNKLNGNVHIEEHWIQGGWMDYPNFNTALTRIRTKEITLNTPAHKIGIFVKNGYCCFILARDAKTGMMLKSLFVASSGIYTFATDVDMLCISAQKGIPGKENISPLTDINPVYIYGISSVCTPINDLYGNEYVKNIDRQRKAVIPEDFEYGKICVSQTGDTYGHNARVVAHKGRIYTVFQTSTTTTGETHIYEYAIKMAISEATDIGDVKYVTIISDTANKINEFTINRTYNHSIAMIGDILHIKFSALVNSKVVYLHRSYNTSTGELSDIVFTKLSYQSQIVDWSYGNMTQLCNDVYGTSYHVSEIAPSDTMETQGVCVYDGVCYTVATATKSSNKSCVLMRSSDMVIWTPVKHWGNCTDAGETEITITNAGAGVCMFRTWSGIEYFTFTLPTLEKSNNVVIPNAIVSKPFVFTWQGNIYLIVNMPIEGYVSQYATNRIAVTIYKLTDSGLVEKRKVFKPSGIHYYSVYNYKNDLYIAWCGDERHYDSQVLPVTDIMISKINPINLM